MQQSINVIGRRKTSVARIFMKSGSGKIVVNDCPFEQYFPLETHRNSITKAFVVTDSLGKYDVKVNVDGGGTSGQAGAVILGVARALVEVSEENRGVLRKNGLLTRDPRMVERKKYGQKKARKRFQFSKR
ncbi:MAG: 30S ribosomal protein S9 [Ignavibacteriales bacterium]|nr:30S ribosomal protein S9 [Ignavibacteriales bacterium]